MKALRITTLTALLVLLSTSNSIAFSSIDTLRTVAFTGDAAPGAGSGVKFPKFGFSPPVLNNTGQTAFRGNLTGRGVNFSNDAGIWSEGGGNGLVLVARAGSPAPGTGDGVIFSEFINNWPILNDAGQTAFLGILSGTEVNSSNRFGIWSEGGANGLALVARAGNAAPNTGGANFLSDGFIGTPILNDAGQTAFRGFLSSAAGDEGIWSEGGGAGLALVARGGDAAPGTNSGVNFSGSFSAPVINDAGQTAFQGAVTGTGVDGSNRTGIWSEGGGTGLGLIARRGDVAPGTGANFFFFGTPVINDVGQTAFLGTLTGTGNNESIWSEGGGNGLALVAREGGPAPGTGDGVNFSGGFSAPVINNAGQTAFQGAVTGTGVTGSNEAGIWSEGGGSGLDLVARLGDSAPGTDSGVKFSSTLGGFRNLVLNDAGQLAFVGSLTGPGVNTFNNVGIWAEDTSGFLTLIAREGDLLDVDDGPGTDFRKIRSAFLIGNTGNGDGRQSGFNNLGQLAFTAAFSDSSSGVFVSNLVAIPEPATWVHSALAAIVLFFRRW